MSTVKGQADAFVSFVDGTKMHDALKRQNWLTFARNDNGPGKAHDYATKLLRAYGRAK